MRRLYAFRADQRGNVAIMFGLAVVPLFMLTGAAIDFGRMTSAHSKLQSTGDAAALDAVIFASQEIAKNGNASPGQVKQQFKQMVTARSNTTQQFSVSSSDATFTQTATQITVIGTASASVKPMFGKFLGFSSYSVDASSTVTKKLAEFANISLVLDVSPSMAIAATPGDIAKLQSATGGCAFACHDVPNATLPPPSGQTNYDIARANNVTLRIDVVKQAAQQLATFIPTAQSVTDQYSVGVYTMGLKLQTLLSPTTNMSTVSSTVSTVDFDRMSDIVPTLGLPQSLVTGMYLTNFADSDFKTTLSSMNALVPAPGNGSSTTARTQYVFLVTDGLSDVANPVNPAVNTTYSYPPVPNFTITGNDWGKTTQPLDPTWCDQFKNRGVQVAVLYVTYVPNPSDPTGDYQKGVQFNAPPAWLQTNLTACASPGLFREATDASQIGAMLTDLFNAVASTPRLTN